MSTILKALRRLEQERNTQVERSLRDEIATSGPADAPTRRRLPGLPVFAALTVGLLIGAGVLALWPGTRDGDVAPGPAVSAPAPVNNARAAAVPAPVLEPERPAQQAPVAAVAATRAATPATRSTPRAEPSTAPVQVVKHVEPAKPLARAAAPTPKSETPIAATPPPPARAAKPAVVAAKPAKAKPAPQAKPTPGPAALVPTEHEKASEIIVRAPVPSVFVKKTKWHPVANRRVAVVTTGKGSEALSLHEGDVVGPLVVSLIEPSGVVFDHEGVELRKSVGQR